MPTGPENLKREVERTLREHARSKLSQRATLGQVDFNIDPIALPRHAVDTSEFLRDVSGAYNCRFDDSETRRMLPPGASSGPLDPASMMALAFEHDRMLGFRGGILQLEGLSGITPIHSFGIGQQQVSAVVNGSTDEALYLCKNVCLSLWRSAGVERRWEDIEPYVERIHYKSTTIVELPFPLMALLSAACGDFIEGALLDGPRFGAKMGLQPMDPAKAEVRAGSMQLVAHCERIKLVLSAFDPTTGMAEDNDVNLLIHSRSDANSTPCKLKIGTELALGEHISLVEKLVEMVEQRLRAGE